MSELVDHEARVAPVIDRVLPWDEAAEALPKVREKLVFSRA